MRRYLENKKEFEAQSNLARSLQADIKKLKANIRSVTVVANKLAKSSKAKPAVKKAAAKKKTACGRHLRVATTITTDKASAPSKIQGVFACSGQDSTSVRTKTAARAKSGTSPTALRASLWTGPRASTASSSASAVGGGGGGGGGGGVGG